MKWLSSLRRFVNRQSSIREGMRVQRNLSLILAGLMIAVVAAMGLAVAGDSTEEIYRGQRLLGDVSNLIRNYYVDDASDAKMYENAIQGMLQGQDRFSAYIPPEEVAEFQKQVEGKFGGIGIVIGEENGWLSVISPIEDGPSYRAGVMAGDRIVEIGGKTTESMTLKQAVDLLTGKPGTQVTFTVIHMATLKRQTFTITREIIHIKTVKGARRDDSGAWQYIIDPDNGIGYIRLTSFTNDTVADLKTALDEAQKQGMKSLVLDLRFNGGGVLEGAIGVADLFLREGVIVATKGRVDKGSEARAKAEGTIDDFPMVVLVNNSSASASEIVAGALQDHNRAVVVGERSYGKGSVQRLFPVDGGKAYVKLTVAKYYLPSGRCLHRDSDSEVWGVDPLIKVEMTPQEYADVFMAWRDADVLRGNGNADADDGDAEAVKTGDAPAVAPATGAGGAAANGEVEKKDWLSVDKQTSRAIDVLRLMPVVQRFGAVNGQAIQAAK